MGSVSLQLLGVATLSFVSFTFLNFLSYKYFALIFFCVTNLTIIFIERFMFFLQCFESLVFGLANDFMIIFDAANFLK